MVSNDLENSLKNKVHIRKTLTNLKSRRNGWHVSAITLRWLPLLANWQIVLDPEDGNKPLNLSGRGIPGWRSGLAAFYFLPSDLIANKGTWIIAKREGPPATSLRTRGWGGGGPPLPRCRARGQGVSANIQIQPQDGGRVKMHRFSFVLRTRPRIMCNCSFSGAPRADLNVVDADTFTI
ncbi:unnamed protein product [Nyctereutes procyonoides]|uniref:(raccoon dog) hypothetical protein n=1 Tax=Nyctereutes procyonoides TaxID=34880 RepID=A0A811ZNR7_NYCPR|nr:unnamed protein product [Nyctereutes procyonoides]